MPAIACTTGASLDPFTLDHWPAPPNEAERLTALKSFSILDTGFEESFDAITALAARLFNVPICLVSLVDEKRQWFKSNHGLDVRETCRDRAFCAHAILPPFSTSLRYAFSGGCG